MSASGFTKDLEKSAEFLHPAGPEEDDDDDEEEELEDDDDENGEGEASDNEAEKEDSSFNMDEYKHAMMELEGLKVSETPKEEERIRESKEAPEEASKAGCQEETGTEYEDELKEAEDECPELAELSSSNKEFKPFR